MPNRIRLLSELTAVTCALLLIPATTQTARAQQQAAAPAQEAARIPDAQLDSLVAPIALYPDPLLAQVLAASTYPLELVQLQQWLGQHAGLKDQALADAVAQQDWDPSVQEMAALPDVVKLMTEDIKWTTDLGNAFLAQQSDVMDAVQRMRAKAKGAGKLTSSEQMKVETKVVENKTVVVIEQANPQVVYVPSYDPAVVYGAPVYPYPPLAYPPVGSGYYAGRAVAFGVGVAVGAAFWHGGWGYGCGWGGHNQININNNNTFVRNSANRAGQPARGGQGQWQHNPQHRAGAPYGNRETASRYGGTTRDASAAQRQASARQQPGGARAQPGAGRQQTAGAGRQQTAGAGRQQAAASPRGGAGGGGERVGNRSVSPGAQPRGGGAFGGGSAGYSGGGARASSSRGSASTGGRRGGGGGGRRR